MEEKNELNDILVKNKDQEKSSNLKNILLFSAITLLIFFIGVLAFKMISQEEPKPPVEEITLPAEPQATQQELFENVPVKEGTDDEAKENLDEMIKRIKESKAKEESQKADEKIPDETKIVESTLPPVSNGIEKADKKAIAAPVKSEPAAKIAPVRKSKQYFIQVASLSKFEPNKKFLATITGNNYKYKIVSKKINGTMIKRIYIGPFESSEAARKELINVHDKISDKAFVIKD